MGQHWVFGKLQLGIVPGRSERYRILRVEALAKLPAPDDERTYVSDT